MARYSLSREIAVALVLKVLAIAAIYFAFFSPSHRTKITPAAMTASLTQSGGAAAR